VTDIAEGVRLAQAIAAQPTLEFAGIQGYAGHAQHIADPGQRRIAANKAAHMLRNLADAL
jgi:D-serine deaminase-like pyridoxal phosphate-dependent protein